MGTNQRRAGAGSSGVLPQWRQVRGECRCGGFFLSCPAPEFFFFFSSPLQWGLPCKAPQYSPETSTVHVQHVLLSVCLLLFRNCNVLQRVS
jgi:hypothetical protein